MYYYYGLSTGLRWERQKAEIRSCDLKEWLWDCTSYLHNCLTFQLSLQSLPVFMITLPLIKLLNYYFCFCAVLSLHFHVRLYQTENVHCLWIMCFIPLNIFEINSNFGPWCIGKATSLSDRGLLLKCSFWSQLVRAKATDSIRQECGVLL